MNGELVRWVRNGTRIRVRIGLRKGLGRGFVAIFESLHNAYHNKGGELGSHICRLQLGGGSQDLRRGHAAAERRERRFHSQAQQASGFLEHAFRAQWRCTGDDQPEPGGGLENSARLSPSPVSAANGRGSASWGEGLFATIAGVGILFGKVPSRECTLSSSPRNAEKKGARVTK